MNPSLGPPPNYFLKDMFMPAFNQNEKETFDIAYRYCYNELRMGLKFEKYRIYIFEKKTLKTIIDETAEVIYLLCHYQTTKCLNTIIFFSPTEQTDKEIM